MLSPVDTKDPTAVETAVQKIYSDLFPGGDPNYIPSIFRAASDCFQGRYDDYQPIDARYHDFEHTLQGTLCMARLLRGRHKSFTQPRMDQRTFELALAGILMHDTGYLKKRGDNEGTGAKYTLIHVSRSCDFAGRLLGEKGFTPEEIQSVQCMIRCTGVNVELASIPFANEVARISGFALGTADLMGQMAAPDYVDKLPILFSEFQESAQYNQGKNAAVGMFKSAEDLMRKTPAFWEKYVFPKIENDFQSVYRFLNDPWPDGPNWYLIQIGKNIDRLKQQFQ